MMTFEQAKACVLYEDNHLLVVCKPVNMPVQADASSDEDLLTAMKAYVKQAYNKPGEVYLGLVHRLDRPVGGAMDFARTSKAARYGGGKPGEQIALWGRYLDLEHPTQKVPMHFDCPPPNAFPFQLFTDICREQA